MMQVMRTTVAIADPVLENAKRQAAERGITLSELVQEGLVMVMNSTAKAKSTKPFVLKTVGTPGAGRFPV